MFVDASGVTTGNARESCRFAPEIDGVVKHVRSPTNIELR